MAVQLDFGSFSEDLPAGLQFWQQPLPRPFGRCLRLGAHAGVERPVVFDRSGVCAQCWADEAIPEEAF